jgi:hypothetical protein
MSIQNTFSGGADKKVRVNAIDPPKELNITGSGVTVTDNPAQGRYDIVVTTSAPGSGEANTSSNAGLSGVGVVLPKSIFNLPFKAINPASSKVSVSDNVTNKTVDLDVVEANLNIANMTGNLGNTRITDLAYSKLSSVPSTIVKTDQVNTFGTSAQEFQGPVVEDMYQDLKTITTPSNPPANYIRMYAKAIDASNYGIFILTLEAGSFQEVRVM